MSHFEFLAQEWPQIHESALKAELAAKGDPRTACIYARRALELQVDWMYEHDPSLSRPYQNDLSALIHEPSFKRQASEALFAKANLLRKLGNKAVHDKGRMAEQDGITGCRELFHLTYWLARTYARKGLPDASLGFEVGNLPHHDPVKMAGIAKQAQQLLAKFQENSEKLAATEETLKAQADELAARDQEIEELRREIAQAKAANAKVPDSHDYNEEQTRDEYIDLLLGEVGWGLEQAQAREFPVTGMPNPTGQGFVDYVLWGDDGKPLGLVEAKRTKHDAKKGQAQGKHYADCLEKAYGQRPVIFLSNGYDHWIWDDVEYPPRRIQGFYSKDELALLVQRRQTRKLTEEVPINEAIVDRPYQHRAIRNVTKAFERQKERKALLVMATGAGKTRTAAALIDLLMRCNWVRRVLFLADRTELVGQAVNAFKQHIPDLPPVNLLTEKETEGRVYVSTYPTIMNQIEQRGEGRRFFPGSFDLIIIDEAHRSIFRKYRAIFDYFDSLLVGLTATPKDEIDRNTYGIFDLENGVPTDAYALEEAIKDGFLVPPHAVSVPLKFPRQGIRYDDLSEVEKQDWDALEWDDDGTPPPNQVEAAKINKWLFNTDTIDKMLRTLMEHGLRVEGGDKLGKTIIFAKNINHAHFIAERFDVHYPHYKGEFAQVIAHNVDYHETILKTFKKRDQMPVIAISVDMLDTGIDVPEVVNLVFFKRVQSKTKFWQMIGRGTRLCPNLFGPDQDKEFFRIFDFCENLEFFNQNMMRPEPKVGDSLSTRLFKARLKVLESFPEVQPEVTLESPVGVESVASVQESLLERLQAEVASMNMDNFVVRPHRRLVEKYTAANSWVELSAETTRELETLAELPTEMEPEPEESKRFDLLMLRLQLAVLKKDVPAFVVQQRKVRDIADALSEKTSIPMVKEQLSQIHDLLEDHWWQDVTVPMLETARKALRHLVGFIDKRAQKPIYTDFEDEMGELKEVELTGLVVDSFPRFREKTRHYLKQHLDHIVIHKLHNNKELTSTDLEELRKMLVESGEFELDNIERAIAQSQGLGLFVRSLVGLERGAAKDALAGFIKGKTLSASQLHFVEHITEHLTQNGMLEPGRLYESPFSDIAPGGPEDLWPEGEVDTLVLVLKSVRERATIPRMSA